MQCCGKLIFIIFCFKKSFVNSLAYVKSLSVEIRCRVILLFDHFYYFLNCIVYVSNIVQQSFLGIYRLKYDLCIITSSYTSSYWYILGIFALTKSHWRNAESSSKVISLRYSQFTFFHEISFLIQAAPTPTIYSSSS